MSSFDLDPVQVHAGARLKTHTSTGVLMPPPRPLPPMGPMTNMTPSRVLSSTPDGNEGDYVDRIETLRRKYRKALNPTPIEEIDVGDNEEVLAPHPDQSDFELPPPLHNVVDPSKVTHKFLSKQGERDRLIN